MERITNIANIDFLTQLMPPQQCTHNIVCGIRRGIHRDRNSLE